jgi:hypothetical protein
VRRFAFFALISLISTIWLLAATMSEVRAQAPLPIQADAGSFFHQVTLVNGDSSRTRYRQAVSPMAVHTPLLGGTISLSSAFMYTEQSQDSTSIDVWGPLATELRGDWALSFARMTGFAILPTGKSHLDAVDSTLVSTLYRSDLNFPVRSFGEGLDLGGAITVAHQRDHLGASLGVAYTSRGAYEPFESEGDYRPGDEATFAGGLSYSDAAWTLSVDLAGTFLFTDRLDGLVVFQNGKQVIARGGFRYETRQYKLVLEATEIFRFKDRRLTISGPAVGRLLFADNNRNDFRASSLLSWNPAPTLSLFGSGNVKMIASTKDNDGNVVLTSARLYGYGGGLSFQVGRTEHLDLSMTRYGGWIEEGARDLEGWNVRVNVRLLF